MSSMPSLDDLIFLLGRNQMLVVITIITSECLLLFLWRRYMRSRPRILPGFEALGEVTPLNKFDWQTAEPKKWRPFKEVYNLTMALQKCSLDDLITIDRNHLTRVAARRRLYASLGAKVIDILPSTHPCHHAAEVGTKELYALLTAYLLVRYPTVFEKLRMCGAYWMPWQLHSNISCSSSSFSDFSRHHLRDDISVECPNDAHAALENISNTLDEDFLVLIPAEDGDGYILAAYIACFPQGFDTSTLLGKRVRDIHKPVPGYKEKLEGSMERFFERLETGKFVRRVNWSVVTRPDLYTGDIQTHFHADEVQHDEEVDPEQCFQRSEAQILFRLPGSRALVFVIKTYLYTLKVIKEEGLGGEFADAIEGLGKGNVPEIYTYKRGPVWAKKVKEYLRS